MDWTEKVVKLLEEAGWRQSEVERRAGWARGSLGAKMSAGHMPGADKGVRLARALRVPAEWLFDDEQPWPPPQIVIQFEGPDLGGQQKRRPPDRKA